MEHVVACFEWVIHREMYKGCLLDAIKKDCAVFWHCLVVN
jgi:hypothetical protein